MHTATQLSTSSGHWPIDRKVNLILDGLSGRRPVTELCREAGISPVRYRQWQDQFIEAGQASLAHPQGEDQSLEERVRSLEAENSRLRRELRILHELCLAE
ncbi:MAG: transposase [Thermoflexales bacterium]|nr:transposase [Thermoflexales bacterium]